MNNQEMLEINPDEIILISLSGNKNIKGSKFRIRKITDGNKTYFQEEKIIDKKAYHKNLDPSILLEYVGEGMERDFTNAVIYTIKSDYYIRKTKKGAISVMKREATKSDAIPGAHNSIKQYLIPDGQRVPFLEELGIMNEEGYVLQKQYSKFRQINRFLELLDDEYEKFKDRKVIKVSDLCCGKGYLTLAVHYYFSAIKNMKTDIIGIDLKQDVIDKLNIITKKLNLSGIAFNHGDIRDAVLMNPDIVVALHACDIATDIALSKAVESEACLIMAVPCCQHELFNQIENEDMAPILKYGIMKDKFTELATNALRGLALEANGYDVKMIEFTSLEHTMKNILIKATMTNDIKGQAETEYRSLETFLNVKGSSGMILNAKIKSAKIEK